MGPHPGLQSLALSPQETGAAGAALGESQGSAVQVEKWVPGWDRGVPGVCAGLLCLNDFRAGRVLQGYPAGPLSGWVPAVTGASVAPKAEFFLRIS